MLKSRIIVIMLVLAIVSGCSDNTSNSHSAIIVINGEEYYGQKTVNQHEFKIKEKIGEVKKVIDKEKVPKEDFSSNAIEKGTKIYSVEEKGDIFLIKKNDNKYQIFSKTAYKE